ncbi:integumentary mucin C.1-like isoform X2 [Crassostrea angulata]|uniref:integumentary mucin C.1-like isoform X2 n=1 Tax=Magallana angulata TaxID=2784310 RepID=UPI0022B19CE0|nr:integumentary mucin C.1-like isoform X2 [Crassostrea angulata]
MGHSVLFRVLFAGMCISMLEGERSYHHNGGGYGGHDGEINTNSGCHSDSDCQHHHCDNGQAHCYNGGCHCKGCHFDSDCHYHQCNNGQTSYCDNGGCHCKDLECNSDSDCQHHSCRSTETPYCSSGSCHCKDIVCEIHLDCQYHHCDTNETPYCVFGSCFCKAIIQTTATAAYETTMTTTTKAPPPTTTTTEAPTTTKTTEAPTTTTVKAPTKTQDPITVDPQLLIKCLNHTECSSHVCPAGKHQYCSFGQRSSDCQCTVCTDDSHCPSPAGLVGKCHFNYFDRTYSCVYGIAPDTTTQPKDTTTVPPTTSQHETTTTQQTTLALGIRSCHICGDNDNGIPCDTRSIYTGNLQQCGPGEDFCMTDLIHNGQPFPTIFKRCVREEECRNKWLHQTSDLEHCTNYGNVLVEGHYSCHFCCTSDGCNSNQIPEKSTLYIKA